jgi:indolepyruvate ferredoxin oxidoreductase alpha subunit
MSLETRTERVDPLLLDEVGHRECLLGNQAIVRGALEAGVAFACGYPGTPSSEITDTFARLAPKLGIGFEYSINEKICVEMAFAASLAGARSICAMKHLGLMVAGDPLSTIPYIGVEAGMVIVSAGDPSCRTSPNEQDQRHLGPMLHIPVLDPATPAQAHAMTRFAFELSEATRFPVLVRTTTRVCHSRTTIEFGPLQAPKIGGFHRNVAKYVPVPATARRMRLEIDERTRIAREMMGRSGFFERTGTGAQVVLASGTAAAVCSDLLRDHHGKAAPALWTLGAVHPLPEAELLEALQGVERLLVVEELSPFLEDAIGGLCARHGLEIEVFGKRSGHLPQAFEYSPKIVRGALSAVFGLLLEAQEEQTPLDVPGRPPSMCPGCPHRSAYMAARAAFDDDQLYFNDIGCYTLGFAPPLNAGDALLCMGAGFSLADGVSRVTGKRTVGFMGDSTFFHAGMPALLNAVKERSNIVAVILDNQVTAMTGFQDSPSDVQGRAIDIEPIVRALGVSHLEKIDPYDSKGAIAAFTRAREAEGVSVVLVQRACPVYEIRRGTAERPALHFSVEQEDCRACGQEGIGLRCQQGVTEGYQRNLARSRAVQSWADGAAKPQRAPCSESCPLSLCVQGYAGHIAAGEYAQALGHILERTPLPEIVCRTCDRPCESVCVRGDVDEPVAINDLKRFVVDWAAGRPDLVHPVAPEPDSGAKVAIVGAGPAGLSAAHDLRLRGHAVTLYDAAARPGGVLGRHIPRYRLPPEALERDIGRILALGVEFVGNTRIGVDLSLRELRKHNDAVYLAVGAHEPKRLELAGADVAGVPPTVAALDFLEQAREGTRTDAPNRVVVIGGGNAAIDAARTLRRLGAGQVSLVCLEAREDMPVLPGELEEAVEEGIEVRTRHRPRALVPGAIEVTSIDGEKSTQLPCDLVIVAIGQRPRLDVLTEAGIEFALSADGCLPIHTATCETAVQGLFAGGDVVEGERTVTTAIAWGLRAAWAIDRKLRGPALADRRMPPPVPDPADRHRGKTRWRVETASAPRRQPPAVELAARTNFQEVIGTLSEDDARSEARRCLMCGKCGNCRACVDLFACPALVDGPAAASIDPALCIDCGVCADLCSNGAIRALPGERRA